MIDKDWILGNVLFKLVFEVNCIDVFVLIWFIGF